MRISDWSSDVCSSDLLPDRAAATDPARLAGHDRPEPTPNPAGSPGPPRARHTVPPGDSLWGLAESRLSPGADDDEITRAWRRIWAARSEARRVRTAGVSTCRSRWPPDHVKKKN